MIDFRQELIDRELKHISYVCDEPFKKLKASNRFIDWLFRHYYAEEFSINWYDSEPDDELGITDPMTFNNWIDPYGEGIWDMSQDKVDKVAREYLYEIRNAPVKKDGRLYIFYSNDQVFIYWYGRDCMYRDYWWYMKRRC